MREKKNIGFELYPMVLQHFLSWKTKQPKSKCSNEGCWSTIALGTTQTPCSFFLSSTSKHHCLKTENNTKIMHTSVNVRCTSLEFPLECMCVCRSINFDVHWSESPSAMYYLATCNQIIRVHTSVAIYNGNVIYEIAIAW